MGRSQAQCARYSLVDGVTSSGIDLKPRPWLAPSSNIQLGAPLAGNLAAKTGVDHVAYRVEQLVMQVWLQDPVVGVGVQ